MQSAKVSMVVSIHNLSNSILFVLFVCLFIIGLNNALRFVALINRFILLCSCTADLKCVWHGHR